MSNSKLILKFIGSRADHGHLRLSDFVDELSAFCEALVKTEKLLTGKDKAAIYYRVVDLSHQSPATVGLEAVKPRSADTAIKPSQVVQTFKDDLRAISKRKTPVKVDLEMLEAFRQIAVPLHRHVERIDVVDTKTKVIPIDRSFTQNVEHVIGPDSFSFGSISGRLERVNLHNVAKFQIFPTVGARRVMCEFKSSDVALRSKVKNALDTYVTVYGRLRYKEWDKYPHAIDARDLESHEQQELPSLSDLRGAAPDATESMSAEAFVRSIRDANW